MKTLSLLFIALIVMSCSTESDNDTEGNDDLTNEAHAATIDYTTNVSNFLIESALDLDTANRTTASAGYLSCAQVTSEGNGDGSGTIRVNFDEGCTTRDGDFVKGKIIIEYTTVDSNTRQIEYTYEMFFINERQIEGGGTIVRLKENENGNPQSQLTEDISVSFPNENLTGTRQANRLREWVEGADSRTWTDNVYEISGDWVTQLSNGFNREAEVTTVLRRELSCPVFVSGIIEFTQNDANGSLDYGDGTCDNLAELIINGKSYTIKLR